MAERTDMDKNKRYRREIGVLISMCVAALITLALAHWAGWSFDRALLGGFLPVMFWRSARAMRYG